VKRPFERNYAKAFRLAFGRVIFPRHLDRTFQCFRAGVCEDTVSAKVASISR
jgi:hypothetical protein